VRNSRANAERLKAGAAAACHIAQTLIAAAAAAAAAIDAASDRAAVDDRSATEAAI
jgi:hypothetical protein